MKNLRLLIFVNLTILFFSFFYSQEKESRVIETKEEYEALVNSKEFEDYVAQIQEDDIDLLYNGDECLVSTDEVKSIIGGSSSSIYKDQNVRFILGKCNPVLLVPGIYATKLVVEIQCNLVSSIEKYSTFKLIRLFCGDTICRDKGAMHEEHSLFISLDDNAFGILDIFSKSDKYSSCLGLFMNYFQNPNECPTVDGHKICYKSDYIKVGFYGGTKYTYYNSRCGIEAIQNVIQGDSIASNNLANSKIPAAKSYKTLSEKLIARGYKEGFSLAGLPNDYRRFLSTNYFAFNVFRLQINKLYENTGKPVVIVAHSYGTLLTLTNLLFEKNKDLIPKIKKFVAIAPPFAGSSKLLDVFLHGMNEWNKVLDILGTQLRATNYNIFGQNMMYKSLPTLTELRPLPIAAKIFTDQAYQPLGDAIRERINYENQCRNRNCVTNATPQFDKYFKGNFPIFSDPECAYEPVYDNKNTLNRKCFTNIYNVGQCPTVLTKSTLSAKDNPYGDNVERYCGQKGPQFYYQGECNSNNPNCLDNIYSQKGPYVYDNKEALNYLINRYNQQYAPYIDNLYFGYESFETKEQLNNARKISIEYHNKISVIKDLPPPPVDTDLIYAGFAKTIAALAVYEKDFSAESYNYTKGGDGTVPTWSSLLTGLKWIYEKKTRHLSQNYKLVEYCSRLSQSRKYKFNPNVEQDFIALGCSCLKSSNEYKDSIEDCQHAEMINDIKLIEYIISVVDDPKVNNNLYEQNKVNALKRYKLNYDYEKQCNEELYYYLDKAK